MKKLFKTAGLVLDCYSDPNFVGHLEAQKRFGSELVAPENLNSLSDDDFAIKVASYSGYKRFFPVYNPLVTSISCQYFEANKESFPQEIVKSAGYHLGQACEIHGIDKTASLVDSEECSKTVQYVTYELSDKEILEKDLMKKAEDMVADELHKLSPKSRSSLATDLIKSAGFEGVTRSVVWDYVEKPLVGPMFTTAVEERDSLLKRAGDNHLSEVLSEIKSTSQEVDHKDLVCQLEEFDKLAGFTPRYKDGFIDPYMAVYGGHPLPSDLLEEQRLDLEKVAAPKDSTTGAPMSAEVSRGLSVAQHVSSLSQEYPKGSEEFEKAASSPNSDNMANTWGTNYVKARAIYFS